MGALNPRLAQQQMGLEILRQWGGTGHGTGGSGVDLLQQHQQQQAHWMAARNGLWPPQNGNLAGQGLNSRMMERGSTLGLAVGGPGSSGAVERDEYGTLQTEHVEIDGKLHTMFCVRSTSPPQNKLGLYGRSYDQALGFNAFDYNAAAGMGMLVDGPADVRWAQTRSPTRTSPAMLTPMSPGRSRSPYRRGRGPFSRRSPPRPFPAGPYRGNPPLLERHEQGPSRHPLLGVEPHLLSNPMDQHLVSQQPFGWVCPRRESLMLRHDLMSSGHDYLPRGRDLAVGPTGREHLRRGSLDSDWSGQRRRHSIKTGRREYTIASRGRSRERNREGPGKPSTSKKHSVPLEQAIAAKRSKLAENARREGTENAFDELILFEDREETDEFQAKVDKSHAHYTKVLKEDTIRRRKYEGAKSGRAKRLECLGCGSKKFSDLTSLVTHAIQATDVRKRAEHQGFHRALCELLGWNSFAVPENKRSVSRPGTRRKDPDDTIVWPPTVVVENTRTKKTEDGRWVGMTTTEMTTFLKELGHNQGRPRPIWDTAGHRGFMLVEFLATREGLAEAERLHRHFEANARGRKEWERVQPFWESHLEDDNADEGPEFVRLDETTEEKANIFYGYLALGRDLAKFATGKRAAKWTSVSKLDVIALGGPATKPPQ